MKTWDYAESIESSAIVNIEKKYGIFLDGEFQTANSKKFLKTISPSTEEVLSSITVRSEEHTSELQSRSDLVCRLLLEKKKNLLKTNTYSEPYSPANKLPQ